MDRTKPLSKGMQQINIACAPVMIKGIKADVHVNKYQIKQAKCPFDAGLDLYPDSCEPTMENLGTSIMFKVSTSLQVCLPIGTWGWICERSSSNSKIAGARIRQGVIDSGFTGEILIVIMCDPVGWDKVLDGIKAAQRDQTALAQMIIVPTFRPVFAQWDDTKVPQGRGTNGFGHTDLLI